MEIGFGFQAQKAMDEIQQPVRRERKLFSRRVFLVHGGWAAAVGLLMYQVGRFLGAPGMDVVRSPLVDAGALETFTVEEFVYVAQARAWVRREGQIVRALDAVCPHLGCIVRQAEVAEGFYCPCHGSRYSSDGTPVMGPADAPLRELAVAVKEGKVVLRVE